MTINKNILLNKYKILFLTGVFLWMLFCNGCNVFGAITGTGSISNPYLVSSESELNEAISKKPRSGWTYIAVKNSLTIKSGIGIHDGRYRIYASGDNRTIRRSTNFADGVNMYSRYCFTVSETAEVTFGYAGEGFLLYCDGKAAEIGGGFLTKGFITVYENSKVTLGKNCVIKNVSNLNEETEAGAVKSRGILDVYGVVKECMGRNGGGISVKAGSCTVFSSASIMQCYSITEGGGIYVGGNATFLMMGGNVCGNKAQEEGGGIFCTGTGCNATIEDGQIYDNSALKSAGGIFSGYQACLTLGTTTTTPNIYNNSSAGSGGGVRCNGGEGTGKGGITIINNANIHNNESGNLGGGIACGKDSEIIISNCSLSENTSFDNGGGISINSGVTGISGGAVNLSGCVITGNIAKNKGGGICSDSPVLMRSDIVQRNKADYGGGIYIGGSGIAHLWMANGIENNVAEKSGGGIYIGASATLVLSDNKISGNKCTVNGDGVCVKGRMEMFNIAYVNENNNVYLNSDTYIRVTYQLLKESGYVATIKSASTSVGTKIVQVDYEGKTGEDELYYTGNSQSEYREPCLKKFVVTNVEANYPLRPTNFVNDYDYNWIIISETYTITYNKNTEDAVDNMPENQIKFWHENIQISKNSINRTHYQTTEKHWNRNQNGQGEIYIPGSAFEKDENCVFYAQWEMEKPSQLIINTKVRFYVVNQKVQLDMNEILKKVTVTDNLDSGKKYPICIKKIQKEGGVTCYERGKDNHLISPQNENVVLTEKFMNTDSANVYYVTIFSYDDEVNLYEEASFVISIVENKIYNASIRFISMDSIWSLSSESKWNNKMKSELDNSLKKQSGEGIYHFYFTKDEIEEIRQKK